MPQRSFTDPGWADKAKHRRLGQGVEFHDGKLLDNPFLHLFQIIVIFVEDLALASIAQTRLAYEHTDLRQRLARHHDDPDSAFWGWNDIWLAPAFRQWSIEDVLSRITCPLLAVQGLDDEYGTLEQIRGIARRVPQTQLLELPDCGHSPHRDQPAALTAAVGIYNLASASRPPRPESTGPGPTRRSSTNS